MTKQQLILENERLNKLIKQYEEAIPALVEENNQLRAEIDSLKGELLVRGEHE